MEKYYLSTEGYYFIFRPDKYDQSIKRATLYRESKNEIVDDVRVSAGYGLPEKSIREVINYFEARITLEIIK